jgi:hypothetical protein
VAGRLNQVSEHVPSFGGFAHMPLLICLLSVAVGVGGTYFLAVTFVDHYASKRRAAEKEDAANRARVALRRIRVQMQLSRVADECVAELQRLDERQRGVCQ